IIYLTINEDNDPSHEDLSLMKNKEMYSFCKDTMDGCLLKHFGAVALVKFELLLNHFTKVVILCWLRSKKR
ncbi:MAG: hypothetical protein J6K31_14720, partial [Parabacteroides sp.]|nr:hypothetical protein [Parabacteroides sp.]